MNQRESEEVIKSEEEVRGRKREKERARLLACEDEMTADIRFLSHCYCFVYNHK